MSCGIALCTFCCFSHEILPPPHPIIVPFPHPNNPLPLDLLVTSLLSLQQTLHCFYYYFITRQGLPILRLAIKFIAFLSQCRPQGHDCCLIMFSYKDGQLNCLGKAEGSKQSTQKGNLSAMERFKNMDKRATNSESDSSLQTLHQNSIT